MLRNEHISDMNKKTEDEEEGSHSHEPVEDRLSQNEMLELNILDMQLRQMEQQAVMIEQQILEQQSLLLNLEELKKAKKGQSMIFPFSREIFVEGKLESSDVLVNIGSKTIVRKSIDEAKKIIEKQKEKLVRINEEMHSQIENIFMRIAELEKRLH